MKVSNKKKIYVEKIIIGSSPYSMYEALGKSNENTKTIIIEKSNNIGGAWSLVDKNKYKQLEIAPHILPGREIKTIDKFQKINLVKLEKMNPQPICIYSNKIYKYNNLPFIFYELNKIFGNFFSSNKNTVVEDKLAGTSFNKTSLSFKNSATYFIYQYLKEETVILIKHIIKNLLKISHIGKYKINYLQSFQYPKEGSKEFINSLKSRINKEDNISVLKNEEILSVNVNSEKSISLETTDLFLTCDNLVITNQTYIKKIYIKNNLIQTKYKKQKIGLFYLVIEDSYKKMFSYIHTFDNTIMRLSDISEYIEKKTNQSKKILSVQISPKKIQELSKYNKEINYKEIGDYTHNMLKKLKLLSQKSKIIETIPNSYSINTTDWSETSLSEYKNIKIINNKNITNAIISNYDDWSI